MPNECSLDARPCVPFFFFFTCWNIRHNVFPPVDQATRFQFVLNMKTAKAIGFKIPDVILLRADKAIE